MTLSLSALTGGGLSLPEQEVYIDALGDSILVRPITRARRLEIVEKHGEDGWLHVYLAESMSEEGNMSIERATELIEQVQANVSEAAFDEISTAIMAVQFGKDRLRAGMEAAGNASRTPIPSSSIDSASHSAALSPSSERH